MSDETRWTDLKAKRLGAYRQSKTIAERAAWDFAAKQGVTDKLTTVLPAGVFGPVLTTENLGSVQLVSRLLKGQAPGLPRLGFCIVDVRDVADAHFRAMTSPAAAGQRFIAAHDYMWIEEVAAFLRNELGEKAKKVPTRRLPDFMVRLAGLFDPALRELTPGLGRKHVFSSAKAQKVLGWAPRPAKATFVECAQSLFAKGAA